jgi:hypothetical protein
MKEVKLVRYDAMVTAIEQAAAVDEVKEIRAKAIALEAFAKEAMNLENERKCAQIRIRAERRVGELLRESEKAHGARGKAGPGRGHKTKTGSNGTTPFIKDHGISKDQSSDWQKLATIPTGKFQEELGRPGIPSTEQILHSAYPKKREPSLIANVDPAAADMWGRLCDFERWNLLGRDPNQLFATMTDPMREDVLRLTPLVIAWLNRLNGGTNGLLHSEAQLTDPGTVQLTGRAKENRDLPG